MRCTWTLRKEQKLIHSRSWSPMGNIADCRRTPPLVVNHARFTPADPARGRSRACTGNRKFGRVVARFGGTRTDSPTGRGRSLKYFDCQEVGHLAPHRDLLALPLLRVRNGCSDRSSKTRQASRRRVARDYHTPSNSATFEIPDHSLEFPSTGTTPGDQQNDSASGVEGVRHQTVWPWQIHICDRPRTVRIGCGSRGPTHRTTVQRDHRGRREQTQPTRTNTTNPIRGVCRTVSSLPPESNGRASRR